MAATVSSMGLGSGGVLSGDKIDQLKAVEKSARIDPYEVKIKLNDLRKESYGLVNTYMNTFKANASSLSYDTLFDNTTIDISGSAKVKASSGASVESFTLETVELAKKDITQFGSIKSKDTKVANADGTLEIKIGEDSSNPDKTLNIDYKADMTLKELAQAITDQAGSDVSVSILQTADDKFSIILTSAKTGADQKLTITDKDSELDSDLFDDTNGYGTIQDAQDSEFKYNGIDITRSTNEISDLILGVDITLTKKGDVSKVKIAQDDSAIIKEMEKFVENYNTLKTNLNDMTAYDKKAKTKGVFQGDSFIRSISRDVTSAISQRLNGDSLVNYGISINRDGSMSFDKSIIEKKLETDRTSVKDFFTGTSDKDGNVKDGIFTSINDKIKEYTGYNKQLANYETDLKKRGKNLAQQMKKAQESLDTRYAILTKQFVAYDQVIAKLNQSFSALEMQIKTVLNSK